MTWPFENDTSAITKKLAKKSLQSEKRRNLMVVIAVALAAFLICFTGIVATSLTQMQRNQVVDTYEAVWLGVEENDIETLKGLPEFERVGGYYMLGEELSEQGYHASYVYNDAEMMEIGRDQMKLLEGNLPQKANEVVVSEYFLSTYGNNAKIGDSVTLDIGEQFTKRNEQCIRLLGLEQKVADGGEDSEIMEYFLCNTKLVLERVTNTDMYFTVKDCLEYFDRDMAEQIINHATSFVYRPDGGSGHTGAAAEKMKKLMTEIFVSEEPRLRIRVCASYRFDLNGSVAPNGHRDFGAEYGDYLPNPHINDYNCMGNYTTTINRLLRNHDYIGALEQCVASCKSLNWGDSAVMTSFMRSMWGNGSNNRCIELPDGRIVKPNEAISWLEQQETQANE